MTPETMKEAALAMDEMSISDHELKLIIKALDLVIPFVRARGCYGTVITTHLMQQKERYEGFQESRKR